MMSQNNDALREFTKEHPNWTTRFAPSPSGFLHLGHLVNILYTWGIARSSGGKVILRIEDHDLQRSKPQFAEAILEDLHWLNLDYTISLPQSKRLPKYHREIERLVDEGYVYPCNCSRSQIQSYQGNQHSELWYDGLCRKTLPRNTNQDVSENAQHSFDENAQSSWRFRLPEKSITFTDLSLGNLTQEPYLQCGDPVVFDRNKNFSYQFCVSSDDLEDKIDLVIRGMDILPSTTRQIQIQEILDPNSPKKHYLHHPLILGNDGKKLSKKEFSKSLQEWKVQGYTPRDLYELVIEQIEMTNQSSPLLHLIEPRQFLKYL